MQLVFGDEKGGGVVARGRGGGLLGAVADGRVVGQLHAGDLGAPEIVIPVLFENTVGSGNFGK